VVFESLQQLFWSLGPELRERNKPRHCRGLFLLWVKQIKAVKRIKVLGVSMACLLVFLSLEVSAVTKLADHHNVIFDRLSTEDGLSATVTAITQDQYGFIWIGAQEGLRKYDGYTFETFLHESDDSNSLSNNSVRDILSRSDGTLWIATDGGLNLYDEVTQGFKKILIDKAKDKQADRHNRIKVLFEDSKNRFWIGTNAGLVHYSSSGELSHYHHDSSDPSSLGAGKVWSIFEDSHGNLWIGTEQGGLNRLEPTTGSFKRYESDKQNPLTLSDNHVRAIVEDDGGKIWVATYNGAVSVLDPDTEIFSRIDYQTNLPTALKSGRALALLRDQNNRIWIGTANGLYLYADGAFTAYINDPTDPRSIGDNAIANLFQDLGGVIWAGTNSGINKWNADSRTFPHFKRGSAHGLASNDTSSFAEMPNGDIWIGSINGLSKWNANSGTFTQYSTEEIGLSDRTLMSMAVQGDDLWVGTMSGGVNIIRDDKVITTFLNDPNDSNSLSDNRVSRILTDSRGDVWLTTYGGGVNRYLGNGKFQRFPGPDSPSDQFMELKTHDIVEVTDGSMWIATFGGGVVVLDPETGDLQNLRHDPDDTESLSSDDTISLLSTVKGVWIGTRSTGVNFYDFASQKIMRRSMSHGLASNAIWGMLEDAGGNLWISGVKGLSVYYPGSDTFVLYDFEHGLQSDDFNMAASLKLSDGSFLFGGNNGFNAFHPHRISGNTYVPPVRITSFSKFNKTVHLPVPVYRRENIELAYNDSVIGFEFAAMDYTAPAKNKFRYFLEGFDKEWVESRGAHTVTYTNLDYGDYVFRVTGSNNDGVWNEDGASIEIKVNPPIWATWWAYLVYLLIGVGVLSQVQKANESRLRRMAEKRYSERLQLYIESLEEATDCVLIADANKHLMYANNAINSILGVTPSRAVGRSILSLLFSDPSDASLARAGLRSNGRWHGEVKTRKGSEFVTTEITIAAVHDDSDNETAYVSIARDITGRKKTEAELEKHRLNLEQIVGERTVELEHEIAENKAVQRELAESLKEKELLLKEVHHRVKNNMQVISSMLNIQAETIGDDVYSELLGESQQRIKSMSLIHENLYQSENVSEIDFEDYINMLAKSLHRFYSVQGVMVNLDIEVDNVLLDIETAVPCGIIINELISNSLKHAFEGKEGRGTISVRFKSVNCRYVLEIGDDGKGLPEGFALESSSSMGMEIVSILTQQLDGRLRFESANGAHFEISFPRNEKDVNEVSISS